MSYQLYIANKNYSSWSLRPWVLMRTLEIPFEERLMRFGDGSSWAEFRAFSPTGQVPCLVQDGVTVWDSLAVTEYLAERHAGVWPTDPAARAWARSASAEMHAGFTVLRNVCTMNCGIRVRLDAVSPALQLNLDRIAELWLEGLDRFGGPFLAGETFTAVDAFFAPVSVRMQTYGLVLPEPAMDYAERLLDLPAMQAWMDDALAETWREPAHEAEARAAGAILEDRRAS